MLLNADGEPIDGMFDPNNKVPPTTKEMVVCFAKVAVPAFTSNVFGMVCLVVNSIFAGQLEDPNMLAAVGVGNVTTMFFIVTIFMGINAAQETLTSQAYGNGNIVLCGTYLNRGFLINTVLYIPLALLPALFCEEILEAVG